MKISKLSMYNSLLTYIILRICLETLAIFLIMGRWQSDSETDEENGL
jgi:hypothetical protein